VVDPKTVRAISPLDFTTEVTDPPASLREALRAGEHRGQSIGFS
jgi:hypothetical protein